MTAPSGYNRMPPDKIRNRIHYSDYAAVGLRPEDQGMGGRATRRFRKLAAFGDDPVGQRIHSRRNGGALPRRPLNCEGLELPYRYFRACPVHLLELSDGLACPKGCQLSEFAVMDTRGLRHDTYSILEDR